MVALPAATLILLGVRLLEQDRAVAAQALLRMGQCYEKLGAAESAEARKAYGRVVVEFADQPPIAAQAKARLAEMAPGSAEAVTSAAGSPLLRQTLANARRRVLEPRVSEREIAGGC